MWFRGLQKTLWKRGLSSKKLLAGERVKQKITAEDKFLFSLYKNDILCVDGNLYVFKGYSSGNQITVQYLDKNMVTGTRALKPFALTIGPRTHSVEKHFTNSLGRLPS